LARLRADNRSDSDERAFQKWISTDASHAAAFEMMSAIWEDTGALPKNLLSNYEERQPPWLNRRKVLTGLGTVAVVGSAARVWQSARANVYQTDVGEQKHVVLKDGTQAFLDTDTCIVVGFTKAIRSVDLQYGRVNLRVMPDAERQFAVNAADHCIVTSHSYFDVRRDKDEVSVVLIRGQASVKSEAGLRNETETLKTGQQFLANTAKSIKVVKADLPILLAWQMGQAIFENQTLANAAHEMNRYSTARLEIIDARISNLRISGVYSVGDNVAFADSIGRLLPVKIRFVNDRIELSADDTRMQEG
jgi:transmembrane sensor